MLLVWFVWLLAGLRKTNQTDFYETRGQGLARVRKEPITFWIKSESNPEWLHELGFAFANTEVQHLALEEI